MAGTQSVPKALTYSNSHSSTERGRECLETRLRAGLFSLIFILAGPLVMLCLLDIGLPQIIYGVTQVYSVHAVTSYCEEVNILKGCMRIQPWLISSVFHLLFVLSFVSCDDLSVS